MRVLRHRPPGVLRFLCSFLCVLPSIPVDARGDVLLVRHTLAIWSACLPVSLMTALAASFSLAVGLGSTRLQCACWLGFSPGQLLSVWCIFRMVSRCAVRTAAHASFR